MPYSQKWGEGGGAYIISPWISCLRNADSCVLVGLGFHKWSGGVDPRLAASLDGCRQYAPPVCSKAPTKEQRPRSAKNTLSALTPSPLRPAAKCRGFTQDALIPRPTIMKGRPTQKNTHPNKNSLHKQFAQTISGQFVQIVPLFPTK